MRSRAEKLRRAKLATLLNLLSGALVLSYVWGLLGPGLGLTFLIGLVVCGAGGFHRWGIPRILLSFGMVGVLLMCLFVYFFYDPNSATIYRFHGTLAMGYILACLSLLSLYCWKPEWFEFAQPLNQEED